MWKHRGKSHMTEDDLSIEKVIYDTAHEHPGGAKQLAREIGIQPGTFNNKCDPRMPGHILNINEVRKLINVTGNHELLFELARERGYVCIDIPDYTGVSDMELLNAWADWDAERGETGQAIKKSLEDTAITNDELNKIRKEMFEDFQKELALLRRLESLVET